MRYSTRGAVEGLIKHMAKPSALLVSRPYPSAVSRGTARTGCVFVNLWVNTGAIPRFNYSHYFLTPIHLSASSMF